MADVQIIFKGRNEAGGAAREVARDIRDVGGAAQSSGGLVSGFFGNILSTAGGVITANVIGGITSQIAGLAGSMISGNAAFEQYGVRFATLLDSTELAKERLEALSVFGANTPFELPQVVEADTILQGFGLHAAEAAVKFGFSGEQIRTIAGDVASGTGASFQEMSLLIGKFSTGATGEAIARMMELGITSREELANLGLEFSKSGQLLSPLPESMNTVLGLMQDKYGGLMQAQSATFGGMASNLQDWVGNATRTMGAPVFDVLKSALGDLLGVLSSNAPAINAALTSVGTVLANILGGAISFISGTAIPAFVGAWNLIGPAVSTAWTALQAVGILFGQLAGAAQGWGANIVQQLSAGIMAAASAVIDSLSYIGDIISYYLEPHSPPKLLPNLDRWGADSATVYFEGWGQGDFSIFKKVGSTVEGMLKGLVDVGVMPKEGVIPMVIGTQSAVAAAISQMEQTGVVSEETFAAIRAAAGDAGAEIEAMTRLLVDQAQASREVASAQDVLNATTERYDAALSPLHAQLAALNNAEKGVGEQKRLALLQDIAGSELSDAAMKEKAQREIAKIQIEQQIRTVKAEKEQAVDAAKEKLDAAKQAETQIANEIAVQEKRITAQNEYNALVGRQIQLLEQLNAKAASGGGGGGGGGGGPMDKAAKEAEAAAKAQRDYEFALGGTEGKLAMLRGELANTTEGSAEYWRIKGQINQLEEQHQRELEAATKAQGDSTKAQRDFEYAAADTAGKLGILKNELANTTEGSAEYWRIKGQLLQVEQQYQREQEAAAKKLEEAAKATDGVTTAAKGLTGGVGGLTGGIGGLTGGLDSLAPKIGDLPAEINPVADAFADMKDKMFLAADTMNDQLSPSVQMASNIMGFFRNGLDLIAPVLAPLQPLFEAVSGVVGGFVEQVKIGFAEGGVGGAIQVFVDALTEISPLFALIRAVVEAALPPLVDIVQTVFGIIAGFIETNGADIVAFVQMTWATIQGIIDTLVPPIQAVVSTVFGAIADFLRENSGGIQDVLTLAWDTIKTIIDGVLDVIQNIIVPGFTVIAGFISAHGEQIKGVLQGAWDIIRSVVETVLGTIKGLIEAGMALINGDWQGAWNAIKGVFEGVWEGIKGVLSGALEIVKNLIATAWDAVKGIFSLTWDAIKGVFGGAWDGMTGSLTTALDTVKGAIQTAWDAVRGIFATVWGGIKTAFEGSWQALKKAVDDVLGPIQTAIETAWNAVKTTTETVFGAMKGVVVGIWDGILDALKAPINAAIGAVNGLIEGASAVAEALGFDPIPPIQYLAKGGITKGGLTVLGEQGLERVQGNGIDVLAGAGLYALPAGMRVSTADDTAGMLGSGMSGGTAASAVNNYYNTMNITSNAQTEDVAAQFDWMSQARS